MAARHTAMLQPLATDGTEAFGGGWAPDDTKITASCNFEGDGDAELIKSAEKIGGAVDGVNNPAQFRTSFLSGFFTIKAGLGQQFDQCLFEHFFGMDVDRRNKLTG